MEENEGAAMLIGGKQRDDERHGHKDNRSRRYLMWSLLGNIALIAIILLLVVSLVWEKRRMRESLGAATVSSNVSTQATGLDGTLDLLGERHGLVPKCTLPLLRMDHIANRRIPIVSTELVTFQPDLRYAHENMFSSPDQFEMIRARWRNDMPRKMLPVARSTVF